MTRTPDIGPLGLWYFTETMTAPQAADFAQRVEALGYGALWIPETFGRDPMAHAAWLLANTDRLVVATGIANIHHRHPGAMRQAQLTLAEQSGNRFILGMGVSHAPIVEGVRKITYEKPVATMRAYLEAMAASPYMAIEPTEAPPTLLAALGPKMLDLAGTVADGAHPYWTTPEHTATARKILGPDPWLCVEQKIVMTTDADAARASARARAGDLRRPAQLPQQLAAARVHRGRHRRRWHRRLHRRPGGLGRRERRPGSICRPTGTPVPTTCASSRSTRRARWAPSTGTPSRPWPRAQP